MKRKNKKVPLQFSIRLNDEEFETLEILKSKFAINISGSFKVFLRKYREVLEHNDKDIQI